MNANIKKIIVLVVFAGAQCWGAAADNQLLNAARLGNFEEVVRLLDTGATVKEINMQSKSGLTALMCICSSQMRATDSWAVIAVRRLLEAGANTDIADTLGKTALMYAAGGKLDDAADVRSEIVEMLLVAKANINITDLLGNTALMHAAATDRAGVVRMLLHAGAQVDIKNNGGKTALDIAKRVNGNESINELSEPLGG